MTRKPTTTPDIAAPHIRELLDMHTYCRPARGRMVEAFCARYLDSMSGMQRDKAGNRFIRIGAAPVLWSSHTDTVHKKDGMQKLEYGDGILTLARGSNSACLGADCSVGVWIMRQMIRRNVPGLYIFHDSEEIGGVGSAWIARHNASLLDGMRYAIALDRRGASSVITHQGARCASDEFAWGLAGKLGGAFAPDDSGTFTDTANYADCIPECTNLSVGYYSAHSVKESLDVRFAVWLLERLCRLDVASLPVSRDPRDSEYDSIFEESGTLEDLAWNDPVTAARLLESLGVSVADFQGMQRELRRRY